MHVYLLNCDERSEIALKLDGSASSTQGDETTYALVLVQILSGVARPLTRNANARKIGGC
jgi:hypothetical protein